jgi:hypothetical protein
VPLFDLKAHDTNPSSHLHSGAVLGVVSCIPVLWEEWKSSGPDSGRPQDTFVEFSLRWLAAAGAEYWFLSNKRPQIS